MCQGRARKKFCVELLLTRCICRLLDLGNMRQTCESSYVCGERNTDSSRTKDWWCSSMGLTRKKSRVVGPTQAYSIRICFHQTPRWLICNFDFEKHWLLRKGTGRWTATTGACYTNFLEMVLNWFWWRFPWRRSQLSWVLIIYQFECFQWQIRDLQLYRLKVWEKIIILHQKMKVRWFLGLLILFYNLPMKMPSGPLCTLHWPGLVSMPTSK